MQRLLWTIAIACILVMQIGCSLSGYEERPSEHYDILNEVRKRFQDKPFNMLTRYAGDWEISSPQLIRSVSNRKLYRMAVSTSTYMISPVEIKVSQHGNITDVIFRHARFSTIPKNEQAPSNAASTARASQSERDWIQRTAELNANEKIRREVDKVKQNYLQMESRLISEHRQELARLRNISRNLELFGTTISNYNAFREGALEVWLARAHPTMMRDKSLFREYLLYLASHSADDRMFKHYQDIGRLLGVGFTRADVDSHEYQYLTEFPHLFQE